MDNNSSTSEGGVQTDSSASAVERLIDRLGKVDSPQSDLPLPAKTATEKIEEINKQTTDTFLKLVSESEKTRMDRQKPLQTGILWFVGLQLLAFNALIAFLIWSIFSRKEINVDLATQALDFLKYYIGAVLVELIGMMVFITQSTFTTLSKDIVGGIFRNSSKNSSKNK